MRQLGRLFQSHEFFDYARNRFFTYFLFAAVALLEPDGQAHGSLAGIATSTANGHVMFFVQGSVIVEVL